MKKLASPTIPELNENALRVLKARYLRRDERSQIIETPQGLFERVACAVAQFEGRDKSFWAHQFYELMATRRFLPNSPTLFNAGKKGGQLSACFVLPLRDSLDGIFNTLKDAAKIHQSGGGTGFSFSDLRPMGDRVDSSQGVASGPTSFIRIFDVATETIKQGGTRRGANMAILRVDHPDIFEFVAAKRDQKGIANFNLSVGITDEFMRALGRRGKFSLRHPRDGRITREIEAEALFSDIIESAWQCGDPGLVFLDRINFFNPTPLEGPIESTNPCGEQPLLPFESCNLGSLNLAAYFVERKGLDWELLIQDIRRAVRFLDNVIDVNHFPVLHSAKITKKNRKIGLGVMGFADLLLLMGLPYDSEGARAFGERVMSVIDREAKSASIELARKRKAFPNWKKSLWCRLGYAPMRNATVSTVAPTGTISIIAGVSSGIEPIFSGIFYRNVLSGERLKDIHPAALEILSRQGVSNADLSEQRLRAVLGPAWRTARMVSTHDHVKMQARFQRHSDSAVSKTINLPKAATVEGIRQAYLEAYFLGCKGITVYRDESRSNQVLED